MNAMSLFSSAGVGEYYLNKDNVKVSVANEIIPRRAKLYEAIYPNNIMVPGDITKSTVFNKVAALGKKYHIKLLLASPPCQGISIAGKNRKIKEMAKDERNYLITYVIKMIKVVHPKYIMIENVSRMLTLCLHYKGQFLTVPDILKKELSNKYNVHYKILNAADYAVPQTRKRAIIKINKKGTTWNWPKPITKNNPITVKQAIGDLPSLESGQKSSIKWHFARNHTKRQVLWMKHTPTGHSAFENPIYYPQKANGQRIKGYNSCYRRIRWNKPAPTITIRNDAISSQRNVHPGRKLPNGEYSDARALSVLELMRLTGLPDNWRIPDKTPEILIRQVLGECIPPNLEKCIIRGIDQNE